MSSLVLGEILGFFFNTLTADAKYPVQDCKNFQLPIQGQLSQKQKKFSAFFFAFFKALLNFIYFPKRNDLDS